MITCNNTAVKWGISSCCGSNCTSTDVLSICVYIFIYLSFFYIWLDILHFINTICPYTFIINKSFVINLKKQNKNTWNLKHTHAHMHTNVFFPLSLLLCKVQGKISKLWNVWRTTTFAPKAHTRSRTPCMSHNPTELSTNLAQHH